MSSNNTLAVKPETENDAGRQDFLSPLLKHHFDCEGSLKMIVTLKLRVPIATTIFMVVTAALENEHDAGR
jgi:hypothetical protein